MKIKTILFLILQVILTLLEIQAQEYPDYVNGNLVQFNDNGFWCWYQDERAIIDTSQNKLITGSDASGSGTGGDDRNGQIEGVIYDLNTGVMERYTFMNTSCDDHNAPAFLIRPDGKYITMYAKHYDYYNSRYRIFDGISWTDESCFDWMTIPGGTNYTIAYSNLYYLEDEDRMYNFARANNRCPNFIYSDDWGENWSFGGQISTNNTNSYNKGYYKYWSNGKNRIDFICTEEHPRDGLTSMYHGYIQNGKTYNTEGIEVDDNIYNTLNLPTFEDFTPIFMDNTVIGDNTLRKIWNADLIRYDDGTIAAILTSRINNAVSGSDNSIDPDHAFIYCYYNGNSWSYSYLGQAGKKMYSSEADYTGLGALHPNNKNVIYISTHVDPRNNETLNKREIFQGVTEDDGFSWSWTPITWNSSVDNFRPIIPKWDENNMALLWCRGTYYAAQNYNAVVVGMLNIDNEYIGIKNYVDASTTNTTMANGDALVYTGPAEGQGADDDNWNIRTGYGNDNTILTSSEMGGEDAPVIRTEVSVPEEGSYHVWANFFAKQGADWKIKAGLNESNMQLYRHIACKRVDTSEYSDAIDIINDDDLFLYQAYLGKVHLEDDTTFFVYIDDESIQTGTSSDHVGDEARTWYDGISFASTKGFSVNKSSIEFPDFSVTDSLEIKSNINWQIVSVPSWLSIDPMSGSGDTIIHITTDDNTSDQLRDSVITITADGYNDIKVNVIQIRNNPTLTVSETYLEIGYTHNSTQSFNINSNTLWKIFGNAGWYELSQLNGSNDDTITITAYEYGGLNDHGSTIFVIATGVDTQKIELTQLAPDILTANPDRLVFTSQPENQKEIYITSNVDWTASVDQSFVTLSKLSGTGLDTILVEVTPNSGITRNALITFSSSSTDDIEIEVKQYGTIGIETLLSENIVIYPSMVEEFLTVRVPQAPSNIQIIASDGKMMYSFQLKNKVETINFSNFEKGIYFIRIQNGTQFYQQKIIIR